MAEGKAMDVTSTPTSFVDGRRFVGSNQEVLEQYIQYDSTHPSP
jgi:protein-disulfide isomerase